MLHLYRSGQQLFRPTARRGSEAIPSEAPGESGAFSHTRTPNCVSGVFEGEGRSPDGMRCTLPSYRRAQGTDKKETGNEEGWHCCGKGDEECFSTETDDWFG